MDPSKEFHEVIQPVHEANGSRTDGLTEKTVVHTALVNIFYGFAVALLLRVQKRAHINELIVSTLTSKG